MDDRFHARSIGDAGRATKRKNPVKVTGSWGFLIDNRFERFAFLKFLRTEN
jgi:hypothetical protein